jgi:aryl-alcohol dehydrogenase (NADP+)
MQDHLNLIYREEEREMLPLCREEGIAVIPWSPLARGLLTGNRRRGDRVVTRRAETDQFARDMYEADSDFTVAERVAEAASRRGVTPAQIAIAWLLANPAVTAPIVGASKLAQLDDLAAATALTLSADEMAFLEAAYEAHPVLGHS